MKLPFLRLWVVLSSLAFPAVALAHPGHDGGHDFGWDFTGGFAHPLSGWDHLAAMVAVGLWAAQIGGRARWLVPAAFLAVFALGAALAGAGLALPGVEQTLLASVLALGLLITVSARLPLGAGMALVGLFGLVHGIAHGVEIPAGVDTLSYGAGFVLATALLHAAGLGLGMLAGRFRQRVVQAAGLAIAACGVIAFVF